LRKPAAGHVTGPENQRQFTQPRTGVSPYRRTREGRSPQIILISADMVSPDLYHPDRPLSKHVHLPALRSLMADGTFFANSFCTVPLCAPSRASYLTGRYSYIQGNGERAPEGLETELRPTDIIFPEYLRAAGYVARQFGKSHVGTAKFLDAFTETTSLGTAGRLRSSTMMPISAISSAWALGRRSTPARSSSFSRIDAPQATLWEAGSYRKMAGRFQ
jgi:Sulfatase